MQESDIKSLTPIACPHCNKDIVIEFTTKAPELTGVYTPEVLEAAKKEALAKIEELNLPGEFTKATIEWINNPDTIFGPKDVWEIIKNMPKADQDEPEEEIEEETP